MLQQCRGWAQRTHSKPFNQPVMRLSTSEMMGSKEDRQLLLTDTPVTAGDNSSPACLEQNEFLTDLTPEKKKGKQVPG